MERPIVFITINSTPAEKILLVFSERLDEVLQKADKETVLSLLMSI
jgi:hypothetical protein